MALKKKEREELHMMFGGKCAYCGEDLKRGWHADYIGPVEREWLKAFYRARWIREGRRGAEPEKPKLGRPERDCIENMFPACRNCNCGKSAYNLEMWRRILSEQPRMAFDYSSNYRWSIKFGLVALTNAPVVFYFERMRSSAHFEANQIEEVKS